MDYFNDQWDPINFFTPQKSLSSKQFNQNLQPWLTPITQTLTKLSLHQNNYSSANIINTAKQHRQNNKVYQTPFLKQLPSKPQYYTIQTRKKNIQSCKNKRNLNKPLYQLSTTLYNCLDNQQIKKVQQKKNNEDNIKNNHFQFQKILKIRERIRKKNHYFVQKIKQTINDNSIKATSNSQSMQKTNSRTFSQRKTIVLKNKVSPINQQKNYNYLFSNPKSLKKQDYKKQMKELKHILSKTFYI